MVAYSFKDRFADLVAAGEKRQTILGLALPSQADAAENTNG